MLFTQVHSYPCDPYNYLFNPCDPYLFKIKWYVIHLLTPGTDSQILHWGGHIYACLLLDVVGWLANNNRAYIQSIKGEVWGD